MIHIFCIQILVEGHLDLFSVSSCYKWNRYELSEAHALVGRCLTTYPKCNTSSSYVLNSWKESQDGTLNKTCCKCGTPEAESITLEDKLERIIHMVWLLKTYRLKIRYRGFFLYGFSLALFHHSFGTGRAPGKTLLEFIAVKLWRWYLSCILRS